jgi:hypothetical protein
MPQKRSEYFSMGAEDAWLLRRSGNLDGLEGVQTPLARGRHKFQGPYDGVSPGQEQQQQQQQQSSWFSCIFPGGVFGLGASNQNESTPQRKRVRTKGVYRYLLQKQWNREVRIK